MPYLTIVKWLAIVAAIVVVLGAPIVYVQYLLSSAKVEAYQAGYAAKTSEVSVATEAWITAEEAKTKEASKRADVFELKMRSYQRQAEKLNQQYANYVLDHPEAASCIVDAITTGVWRSAALGDNPAPAETLPDPNTPASPVSLHPHDPSGGGNGPSRSDVPVPQRS